MNLFDFPLSIQTNFGPCPRKKTKKKNCWILRDIEKHAVALDLSRMSPNTPVFMYIYDWTSYVHIYNTYERETTVRETLSPPTVHQSFPEFEMSILICFFVYRIHCFWFLMRFCVFFLFNTPRRNPIRDARVVLGRTGREEFYFILFLHFGFPLWMYCNFLFVGIKEEEEKMGCVSRRFDCRVQEIRRWEINRVRWRAWRDAAGEPISTAPVTCDLRSYSLEGKEEREKQVLIKS